MKEQLSALMDGELDGDDARIVFGKLKQTETLREDWEIYHLIGDGLRQTPLLDSGFSARFAERLAAEPTILAPQLRKPRAFSPKVALSMAASLAAVSVVAWTAFQLNLPDAPKLAMNQEAVHLSSASVSGYVNAHQEYSTSAYYGASPYSRASVDVRRGDQ
ncbi:MAG: sigma-E factor negative regulatory protein [Sulfuricella sp.]|nr:sigma-E factor negative regulatory protein [Sulfuricella sp.]